MSEPKGAENDASGITIESGVGSFSGEGYVVLRWGDQGGQLTPREARLHAMRLIEAAESAETDAIIYAFFRERLNAPPDVAAAILTDIRERRTNR